MRGAEVHAIADRYGWKGEDVAATLAEVPAYVYDSGWLLVRTVEHFGKSYAWRRNKFDSRLCLFPAPSVVVPRKEG